MNRLIPADFSRAAVFCTALVDSDPARYQSWIDYYTDFFAGQNVDLYLYNDGPVIAELDLKGAQLVTFPAALGRQDTWIFPGWKRSLSAAVRDLGARYRFLAHIESDTIVLKQGRAEFLRVLRRRGYRTGYTTVHDFIETAVQVLNTRRSRQFFRRRYVALAALHREEDFEKVVQYSLQPALFLHGERVEGRELNLHAHYSYSLPDADLSVLRNVSRGRDSVEVAGRSFAADTADTRSPAPSALDGQISGQIGPQSHLTSATFCNGGTDLSSYSVDYS